MMTAAERSLAYFHRKSRDPLFKAARAEKAREQRRERGLQRPGPKSAQAIYRFCKKFVIDDETGCWLWTGFIMDNGYGRFGSGGKRGQILLAHRFSYEHFVGKIPDDEELHHKCLTKRCVNPQHLRCLTHAVHMRLHR